MYREKETNSHVKILVLLRDMNRTKLSNPHFPVLINGMQQYNTNGRVFQGALNANGPSNIALFHHYATQSYSEYVDKRLGGSANQVGWTPSNPGPEC